MTISDTTTCILGAKLTIVGEIRGEQDLVVEGRVQGNLTMTGQVTVTESGFVAGNIEADGVEIRGQVQGDVVATARIVLEQGGQLTGDVRAPQVAIREGAKFRGAIEMEVDVPVAKSSQSSSSAPKSPRGR